MRDTLAGGAQLLRMSWRLSRHKTVAAVALMVAAAVAAPLLAAFLGAMANAIVSHRRVAAAWYGAVVATLAVTAVVSVVFAFVLYYELSELAELDFGAQLMTLSNGSAGMEHHQRSDYADALTVIQPESKRFAYGLFSLFNLVGLLLAVTLTSVLLARLNLLLLLLPVAAVAPLLAGRRAERTLDRARTSTAETTRTAWSLFQLATTPRFAGELRVFGLGAELGRRHAALWAATTRGLWHAYTRAIGVRAAAQVAFGLAYVGAVLLVIRDAVGGRRSVGDIVLVIVLAAQVNQQLATAIILLGDLQRVGSVLTRLESIRGLVSAGDPLPADRVPPDRLTAGIELREVGFGYPGTGRQVVSGVSVTLPAGATVAVVGENGAGKSTLVALLCGLYRPTHGQITVDGTDLRRLPPEQWRERIAVGFQDFVRYELTAGNAVGVGDLRRIGDEAAVRAALGRAQAADVIGQLPDGLATQLGSSYARGVELSGGQWQKLALGRALMRPAPLLLVLDEPTSALDAEAEHRLFERYAEQARRARELAGAITLIVSHRFSTVRMADLIVVLRDGRVAEAGDHETLMRAGGLYAELFRLQAKAYR